MNKFIRLYIFFGFRIFCCYLLLISIACPANLTHQKTINILTWLGYLNYPSIISAAEKTCHVKISFDEYYSNDEFLRRWQSYKDDYDIIIFSDTIYKTIKDKIPKYPESTLWQQSKNYNPIIKSHYDKQNYPHNLAYFYQSITGFLWNPDNIDISNNDSVITLFKKAKNKYVVLIDDPVEEFHFIQKSLPPNLNNLSNGKILSISNFNRAIQESRVYIANSYGRIYKNPQFAFSFDWSGEAIANLLKSKKEYKFLINPKLSHISSDLILQATNNNNSLCVARYLSGIKNMSVMQNKSFYFSPYVKVTNVINKNFKKIYDYYINSLPKLSWVTPPNKDKFQNLNESWQLIKLSLNNHSKEKL